MPDEAQETRASLLKAPAEREPAAATRTSVSIRRGQLADNDSEIDILPNERVELDAVASDVLIEMIETKLEDYGLEKVIPDEGLLAETYRAVHRSERLRRKFEDLEEEFDEEAAAVRFRKAWRTRFA